MTLRELNRATLARQGLLERSSTSAVEMVERLMGMQAQEPKPPFLALWSRIEGFDAGELRAALDQREIVRATLMRATLHLMSARDFAAFRTTLQPALDAAMASILKARGEGIVVDDVLRVARELLAKGPLTFDGIRDHLRAEFPDVDHRALGYVTRTGLPLVMVATDDAWGFPRDSEFALADAPAAESATHELVRRYLAAFGPATPADMQVWSGLKGLKGAFAELEDELEVLDGNLYDAPGAPRPDAGTAAPVRFLPAFDQMLLAHKDRARIIDDEHRPRVATKNLRIHPTFLVDGFVAGMWRVQARKASATLEIEPFVNLSKRVQRELAGEGEALLRFAEPDVPAVAVTFVQ